MPAFDIEAEIRGWVADEAQKQSFTDKIGTLVKWDRRPVPTQAGMKQAVQWTVIISLPVHLLGVPPLLQPFTFDQALAIEQTVRKGVADAIAMMRNQRDAIMSAQRAGIPPGLARGAG